MIALLHSKNMIALHEKATLMQVAEALRLTLSLLSHQIRELEKS
jgi:DNA-binding transcriptional LysR family regulator